MNTPQGMKPFSLTEWQNGAKPICRNGYEPTDLHYFHNAKTPLSFTDPDKLVTTCYKDGSWIEDNKDHALDLFLRAGKKEGWINLYKSNLHINTSCIFNSEEDAKKFVIDFGPANYLTTVKIEYYE